MISKLKFFIKNNSEESYFTLTSKYLIAQINGNWGFSGNMVICNNVEKGFIYIYRQPITEGPLVELLQLVVTNIFQN